MKKLAMVVMVMAAALQLGGCGVGSHQARSVDLQESPLVNPNIFVQGTDDEALYRYVNPKADIKQYTNGLDRSGPGVQGWGAEQG